jgi:hypothetical protein
VQAKQFFFAKMMCKHLIFCVKAATRLAVYLVETTKLCGTRSLFDMAVSIADQFEILPTIPRRTGQINRAGHPADNPSQFWQRSMYYPFMDYYISQ